MTSLIKYNAAVVKFRIVQSCSTCLLWQGGSSQRLWSLKPEWYWQQFTVWGVPSWTSKIEIFLTSAPITTVGLGWGELWLSASNLDQRRKEKRKKSFSFLSLCIHQKASHLAFVVHFYQKFVFYTVGCLTLLPTSFTYKSVTI